MNKLKVAGLTLSAIGLLGVVGSFVWRGVAVPALVRYPTDLDVTPQYEGTVTVFLDPQTYAPLTTPAEYPLTVERHLQALGDESSKDLVVVRETLTLAAPGLFDATVQEHQYVMDRREMVNVDDPRAWAFTPDNPVNRAGAFRLQFPFDADAATYPVYKNETDATYTATRADGSELTNGTTGVLGPTGAVPFDDLTRYTAESAPAPITDAYREALVPIVTLPDSLTIDQIRPILARAGVDLDATLAALLPAADPADVETLLALAAEPVGLSYSDGFSGSDLLETYTGSIVAIPDVTETIYATPDPAVTEQLHDILAKYPEVPEALAAAGVIADGDLDLIPVFTNEFHQTPASIVDIWGDVEDQKGQRRLAEVYVPWGLLIGGVALDIAGTTMFAFRLRRQRSAAAPVTDSGPA